MRKKFQGYTASMSLRLLAALAVLAGLLAGQAPAKQQLSAGERAALTNITATFKDATTTDQRMDQTLTDFRRQYPQSSYMEAAMLLGVRYYRAHSDYLRMLEYGTQVLALDPHNLYTLSSLGSAIPDNVKQSDLDMEQRLAQAEGYDREVIAVASGMMPTYAGLDFQGIHYTAVQAKTLQQNLEGPAYLSLGRIASLRQQYDAAVTAFRQALPFETTPGKQGQVYYDIGEAQANGQHLPEAEAALAKALTLATDGSLLQRMVRLEQEKLKNSGQ